jgi:hypothetical protein
MGSSQHTDPYQVTSVVHASYVSSQHKEFLQVIHNYTDVAVASSPFAGSRHMDVENDFFGFGYTLSSLTSLYDLFGNCMAGLDIDGLWNKTVGNILSPDVIKNHKEEEKEVVNTKVEMETLPSFLAELRDSNAVVSSSFIIGKSVIEDKRIKDIEKIDANSFDSLFPKITESFTNTLNWSKDEVTTYAYYLRDYYTFRFLSDETDYRRDVDNILWPFTVMEYERKGLGAFHPVTRQALVTETIAFQKTTAGRVVTVASWTATGAYIGWSIGTAYPGIGNVVGGVVGGVVGLVVGLADVYILNR